MAQLDTTSLNGDGNLLAYYKFNTGALTTDSSGNSRTLTNNNTVGETSSGKYGYAADYGDPNTNKYFSRNEDIWTNGAMSFVCWLKRDSSDSHSMFGCFDAATDKQLYLNIGSANLVGQIYRVGVAYDTVSAAATIDTNWHHYALTLTTGAGGTMKIYQDGVELNSGSVVNGSGTIGQADQYRVGLGPGSYCEGFQDDVAFFNDVLTESEIQELAFDGYNAFIESDGILR